MYRRGHLGMGLVLYAPVGFVLALAGRIGLALGGAVVVSVLASVPDLDMRVPLVTHRGITHTVWFAIAVGVVAAVAGGVAGFQYGLLGVLGFAVLGGVIGALTIVSHIIADACTPMGVQPFAPVRSTTYTWDLVKASSPIANYGLLAIGAVLAATGIGTGLWIHTLF